MLEYKTAVLGYADVSWAGGKGGLAQHMDQVSSAINAWVQQGWRLHTVTTAPLFGKLSHDPHSTAIIGVFEAGSATVPPAPQ